MFGLFDSIFDFDGDGRLDSFERAAEAQFVNDFLFNEDKDDDDSDDNDDDW